RVREFLAEELKDKMYRNTECYRYDKEQNDVYKNKYARCYLSSVSEQVCKLETPCTRIDVTGSERKNYYTYYIVENCCRNYACADFAVDLAYLFEYGDRNADRRCCKYNAEEESFFERKTG